MRHFADPRDQSHSTGRNSSRKTQPVTVFHQIEESIKILIDTGADINAKDKYGKTVSRFSWDSNNPKIISLLKVAGAKE
jgi:ankyrin repeat protein